MVKPSAVLLSVPSCAVHHPILWVSVWTGSSVHCFSWVSSHCCSVYQYVSFCKLLRNLSVCFFLVKAVLANVALSKRRVLVCSFLQRILSINIDQLSG